MKIKTSILIGPALDWAVAKAIGEIYSGIPTYDGIGNRYDATLYSTDWDQGGPILDKYIVELVRCSSSERCVETVWFEAVCGMEDEPYHAKATGPTKLIAVMRAYVISRLGYEIEIPENIKLLD